MRRIACTTIVLTVLTTFGLGAGVQEGHGLIVHGLITLAAATSALLILARFHRRRHDAARTLQAFGARMCDEVERDVLAGDLRAVVTGTMRPTHMRLRPRRAS